MPALPFRVLLMICIILLLTPACSSEDESVVDAVGAADTTDTMATDTRSDVVADTVDDDMLPNDVSDAIDTMETMADVDADDTLDTSDMSDDMGTVEDVQDTHMADVGDMEEDLPETMDMMMPNVPPLAGFGAITGMCDVLDTELTDANAHVFVNAIDFGTDPYDMADLMLLTMGGQKIIADGNAGGSSIFSEVFAFEALARCELATLLKTETEVVYTTQGKITDLLVEIDGTKIGVSVTRAVGFPRDDPYTVTQAQMLLEDKLSDILESSANVAPEDAWAKQILHVVAYAPMHAQSLQTAFGMIDPMITADTILMITVSNGDDAFLY